VIEVEVRETDADLPTSLARKADAEPADAGAGVQDDE